MFKSLRLKSTPDKVATLPGSLPIDWLAKDNQIPITLRQLNELDGNAKRRIYRTLIPPSLLNRFKIDPITWKGPGGEEYIGLRAEPRKGMVHLWGCSPNAPDDEFYRLELADNSHNGIDLHLVLLNNPSSPRYNTDLDEHGNDTHFGAVRRNLAEEQRAMGAGLAPAQVRQSLGASRIVFEQIDAFLTLLGHRAYFLEPLTYASAWVFERRGFAYVRGHKLMDDIHKEFQPGGRLHAGLDCSTPFRKSEQWRTVRGRAWAIQDGILEVIEEKWDNLRMVKQVGKHAEVETFPQALY